MPIVPVHLNLLLGLNTVLGPRMSSDRRTQQTVVQSLGSATDLAAHAELLRAILLKGTPRAAPRGEEQLLLEESAVNSDQRNGGK